MTVSVIERPGIRVLAVLRRGQLDARDAAIIRAVARADWPACYREIRASITPHPSLSNLFYRIMGYEPRCKRVGGGLVEQGWLAAEPMLARTLLPGPRFAGLDGDGQPLEVVRE